MVDAKRLDKTFRSLLYLALRSGPDILPSALILASF